MGGLLTGIAEHVAKPAAEIAEKYVLEPGLEYIGRHLGQDGAMLKSAALAAKDSEDAMLGPELSALKKAPIPAIDRLTMAKQSRMIARQVAGDVHLGKDDTMARLALKNIEASHGAAQSKFARAQVEHYLGRALRGSGRDYKVEGLGPGDLETATKNVMAMTKLSLAFLSHTSQALNQVIKYGPADATKSLVKVISDYPNASEEALRAGASASRAFDDIRKAAEPESWLQKGSGAVMKTLELFTQFQETWASHAGEEAAHTAVSQLTKNPASKSARHMLSTLVGETEVPRVMQSGLTQSDLNRAMRAGKELSQPTSSVATIPGPWRTSATGRLLTLFKPFVYKQARFLKQSVFDEAIKYNNYKPLLLAATLYPVFGEVNQDIRELSRKMTLEDRPGWDIAADRIIDGMSQLGSLAIFTDTIRALGGGSEDWILSFLLGPVVGSGLTEFAHTVQTIHSNNPYNKLSKKLKEDLLNAVPLVGPALHHQEYPKRQKKTIFQKGEVTGLLKGLQ